MKAANTTKTRSRWQALIKGSGRKLEMGGRDRAVNNHCVIRTVIKHTLRTIGGVHMEMT